LVNELFTLQESKELTSCKTAYVFKGLGRNLIPSTPDKKELKKIKSCIKELLENTGEKSDNESIIKFIGKSPKIGLNITFMERKFIEVLILCIANSTLMDVIQKNIYYNKKGWNNNITEINYNDVNFNFRVKDINKLFGRSITEKDAEGKTIIDKLSSKKFFLKDYKGNIKYQKAVSMVITKDSLKFRFHPFLIGRTYDKRTKFFDDVTTLNEAIFFEYLFNKTKDFRKQPIEHLCFSTRSLLKTLGLDEAIETHKQRIIKNINICFQKAFNKGIFMESFKLTKDDFNRNNKTTLHNILINPEFKWY
jgi:hypothetical protein